MISGLIDCPGEIMVSNKKADSKFSAHDTFLE